MSGHIQTNRPRPAIGTGPGMANPVERLRRQPKRFWVWVVLGTSAAVVMCGCVPLAVAVALTFVISGSKSPPSAARSNGKPPPAVQTAAPLTLDDPVPQPAAAQLQRQRQARRAYLQQTVRDPYETVGKRNPKWDAAARAALDDAVAHWCYPEEWVWRESLWLNAKRAVDAGCDDPFVQYLFARFHPGPFKEDASDLIALYDQAGDAMAASKYPVARRAIAIVKVAAIASHPRYKPSNHLQGNCLAAAQQAMELLPEAARIKGPQAQHDAFALYREIMATVRQCGDPKYEFDRMAAKLAKDPECRVFLLLIKGAFYTDYAWDARGRGWAKDVTPEGWEGMRQRLAVAEEALEEAWRLEPNHAIVATQMLSVELGQNHGRERFELWFKRAMLADGDNFEACGRKLYYLLPKWHGSAAEAVAFGKRCVATGNWEAQLPQVLPLAHLQLTGDSSWTDAERDAYFRAPGIWEDCDACWAGYLKLHPQSAVIRSFSLRYALKCGRDEEAQRHRAALGNKVSPLVFSTKELAELRPKANQSQVTQPER